MQKPLFTLQFGDTNFLRDDLTLNAGRQITLLLDVPQGAQSIKPFKTVCEYGYSLAQRMGAQLVDDNMRPLTEATGGASIAPCRSGQPQSRKRRLSFSS